MSNRLKMWEPPKGEADFNQWWEEGKKEAQEQAPLKGLKCNPKMPGITADTAKGLRWKALKYMIQHDKNWELTKSVLRHPFRHGYRYLRSLVTGKGFRREGDFFYYNIKDTAEFEQLLAEEKIIFVLGFSYCHKPFECPSGRFSDACIADPENAVCRQCFIGKAFNKMPAGSCVPLAIPTVHYISNKMFELKEAHPNKRIVFLISACEMTLEMFSDWGNMIPIHGIGIRLAGRICNTMRAFELSEEGIKPGLTVIQDPAQEEIMRLLQVASDASHRESHTL